MEEEVCDYSCPARKSDGMTDENNAVDTVGWKHFPKTFGFRLLTLFTLLSKNLWFLLPKTLLKTPRARVWNLQLYKLPIKLLTRRS